MRLEMIEKNQEGVHHTKPPSKEDNKMKLLPGGGGIENSMPPNDITSQMSSLNQSLLDGQPSNAISRSFVDLEQESNDAMMDAEGFESSKDIKEAIIDLYLAIKIRSTEELDKINEGNLKDEKTKLLTTVDSF